MSQGEYFLKECLNHSRNKMDIRRMKAQVCMYGLLLGCSLISELFLMYVYSKLAPQLTMTVPCVVIMNNTCVFFLPFYNSFTDIIHTP